MHLDYSTFDVVRDLENLMNERIRPEPYLKNFSKYFASLSNQDFLKNEEILQLINSHGIQLQNDIQYWLGRSKCDPSSKNPKRQIPVLDLEHFVFEDMNDVVTKLQELPSEWTVLQVTKKFSVFELLKNSKAKNFPGIYITRFSCGDLAKRIPPCSVKVNLNKNPEDILKVLHNLVKTRRDFFQMGRTCKKLCDAYSNTNIELMNFIKEFETCFLKQWICLFRGLLEDKNLEENTISSIKKLFNIHCKEEKKAFLPNEKQLNIVYLVTLSAHFMKNKDMLNVLKSVLCRSGLNISDSELVLFVENIKLLNLSRECAIKRASYNPVILILDNEFEMVSWEMLPPLLGQPVCRISSLQMLYATFKYHQSYIKKGYRIVEIDSFYCLINPSKDLESCEKHMKEFLKRRIPWAEVEIGKVPDPKNLISKIEEISAYLYCGHGSGTQYLKAGELKKAYVKGLILLFGCSSNIPRNCGGRTPHQNNTYTYITNGCPCVIGCIQDVSSTNADAACEEMLSCFVPNYKIEGKEIILLNPKEPNVLKALVAGKSVCTKYWSKCAFVARGIPCKTVVGDLDKLPLNFNTANY